MHKKERKEIKLPKSQLRVAIVTDCVYRYSYRLRQLKYILDIFPNSSLFIPWYEPSILNDTIPDVEISNSFWGRFLSEPSCTNISSHIQILAFKSFKFTSYDVVISLSTDFAKFVKVPKNIPHIALINRISKCLTSEEISEGLKSKEKKVMNDLENVITISNYLKRKLKRNYGIESDVIYPPVDISKIKNSIKVNRKENWFLVKGGLGYRDLKLVIRACVEANVPLKVCGDLVDSNRIKELVKKLGAKGLVKFEKSDRCEELMKRCKGFIFPYRYSEFSVSTIEANAFGTPVIAYRGGSTIETISSDNPKTGVFFKRYKYKELAKILKNFNHNDYASQNCLIKAEEFDVPIFMYKLRNYVEDVVHSS